MKIQLNPMLSPEQRNTAQSELKQYQQEDALRTNVMNTSDKLSSMALAGTLDWNTRKALLAPLVDQVTHVNIGRVTPISYDAIANLMPAWNDIGKNTRTIKRQAAWNFMSNQMQHPLLKTVGIDMPSTMPPPMGQTAPPKLGKK